MQVLLFLLAAADREVERAQQAQQKGAALTDLSKPHHFEGPDGQALAEIEKKLRAINADSTAKLEDLKHPSKGTSFIQQAAGASSSSLSNLQGVLRELQERAQAQLDGLRKKHKLAALGDPDAEEDNVFKQLAAEESKTYSEMYQKLGHLQGKAAAKVHALQQGASSLLEGGAKAEAAAYFTGLYGELAALKKGADAEIQKLTKRIIAEPSSMLQAKEIEYRHHFDDLDAKLHELKRHTQDQQRELEQDSAMKLMNGGASSLLQGAAPSSLLEDPALAKRLKSDFRSSSQEFAAKLATLQADTKKNLDKLIAEQNDVPIPGKPSSLLEERSGLDRAFAGEPNEFRAKLKSLEAQTEKQLQKLTAEEKVPVPSSLLQAREAPYAQAHSQFVGVLEKLKRLKSDTAKKLAKIREIAREPGSLLQISPTVLDAKLKKIQADVHAKMEAIEAKAKAGLPSSLLETKEPRVPVEDLDKEVHAIELQSRKALAGIMGDKDMFQGHDLDDPSSFLQGRLVEARRDASPEDTDTEEPAAAESNSENDSEQGNDKDEFQRSLDESEKKETSEDDSLKPGAERVEYEEVQKELKEGMERLRKGLKNYGKLPDAGSQSEGPQDQEDSQAAAEDPTAAPDAADVADVDQPASLMERAGSGAFLREPRLLLEKSDEAATQAATMGLEKQFHDAFRQGFAQGLQQAGGKPAEPTSSFIEAPPANDPPMFAELDKVQAELKNLKSDVTTSFDKVSQLVNSDGSLAQMRSNN